jgi:hypothetical protein
MDIYFKGRPDGMGNRVQELIQLDYFAEKFSHRIIYYWNISQKDKGISKILGPVDYPCRFKCKNIEFVHDISQWRSETFESSVYWQEYISYDRYPHNTSNIEYSFSIKHTNKPYIGIHTRSLDRIIKKMTLEDKYRGLSDIETYNYAVSETIKYLQNQNKYEYLYICGDSVSEVDRIKKMVGNGFKFIEYENPQNIEQYYVDMYLLTEASEVIMASLFSSFAITAPILKNKAFITFFQNYETEVNRFPLNYVYKGKYQDQTTIINLNSSFQPYKVKSLIKLGKPFGKDYLIDEASLLEAKYLISSSKRSKLFFEEHFNLIHYPKLIIFQKGGYRIFLKELYRIFRFTKNRKEKLVKHYKQKLRLLSLDSYRLLKIITFFIPLNYKIKLLTKYLNKIFLFLEINTKNVNILKYLETLGSSLTGLIVEISDYQSLNIELEEFIDIFEHKICYVKASKRNGEMKLVLTFSPTTYDEIESNLPISIDNTNYNNNAVDISFS